MKVKTTFKDLIKIVKDAIINASGCPGFLGVIGDGYARNCPIVLRRCGFNRFEYVFYRPEDKKLYGGWVKINPEWWRIVMPETFDRRQLKGIRIILANMAIATVDTLNQKDKYKDQ